MQPLKREISFLLYEVLDVRKLFERERFADHSAEVVDAVVETAQRLAETYLAPHNAEADAAEPQFDGQRVQLHPATKQAWDVIAEAGFLAAAHDAEWGGIQLPEVVTRAAMIPFFVANVSTAGYSFLTVGVANLLASFGAEAQKKRYLPPLLDGRFSGTMALTEPAQGSALADITSTAEPQADGTYKLKGQKIYISGGDHELTDNIIHMVLAKITGAPEGVGGISLFLCPKYRLNPDGSRGEPNDVTLTGLLHKMGYRNTTSTALSFGDHDDCTAYLVGDAHRGLSYMFQMMNEARIGVGLGAAALGYAGYDYSLSYARDRRQGRLPSNKDPRTPQIPIIEHADVRRMLLAQKSYVEGSLALCLYASRLVDDQKTAPTEQERERAGALLDFLTPVVKSWPSKYALKANDLAIQVLGGAGYIREYPVEQYYRDNRLNAIHEGTEGIQALDLLGRKLVLRKGALYDAFLAAVTATIREAESYEQTAAWAGSLAGRLELHRRTSERLTEAMARDIDLALANAGEYLDFTGRLVLAWMHLKLALAATRGLADGPGETASDFYRGKVQAARYHFEWELPQIQAQAELLQSLNRTPFDMRDAWF